MPPEKGELTASIDKIATTLLEEYARIQSEMFIGRTFRTKQLHLKALGKRSVVPSFGVITSFCKLPNEALDCFEDVLNCDHTGVVRNLFTGSSHLNMGTLVGTLDDNYGVELAKLFRKTYTRRFHAHVYMPDYRWITCFVLHDEIEWCSMEDILLDINESDFPEPTKTLLVAELLVCL